VKYLSSAALSKLIGLQKEIQGGGGDIRLCGMSSDVLKVFEITQLHKVFEIYDSPAELATKMYARSRGETTQ